MTDEPAGTLDRRFSSPEAAPTPWALARERFAAAGLYTIATVRPDGRPHVTPLLAVWLDEAAWIATGADERKARNLAANPRCALTAASDALEGLDVVVEGAAVRERDEATLGRVAAAYEAKYGPAWRFRVRDEGLVHAGALENEAAAPHALVFRIAPRRAFGFGTGPIYSQTAWRFPAG